MTQPVTPAPTPFTFLVGQAHTGDGQTLVMIEIHSITGVTRLFCKPEEAEAMAGNWLQVAQQTRTGLFLPGQGLTLAHGPNGTAT
jgi:hypothetical protein